MLTASSKMYALKFIVSFFLVVVRFCCCVNKGICCFVVVCFVLLFDFMSLHHLHQAEIIDLSIVFQCVERGKQGPILHFVCSFCSIELVVGWSWITLMVSRFKNLYERTYLLVCAFD